MAASFEDAKKAIEVAVIMAANDVPIPHCVEDTGDIIKVGLGFVDAFSTHVDWFMFSVEDDDKKGITVGNTLSRIYGSLTFTVYSPTGQAGSGGAKITDFIYKNFQATRLENILLRDVKTINKFKLQGWTVKVLQVPFQFNVK